MSPWTPLTAATLGWALSIVLSRAVLEDGVDTFTMLPIRMAFAMITLALVIVVWRRFGTLDKTAWVKGGVLGVLAMGVPMGLITLALEDLPVSISGLLIALIPLTTVAAAHYFVDGERFQARSLPGLLLALIGSAVLVGVGGETVDGVDNLWRGVGYVSAGVVLAGLGGALSRRFALQLSGEELVLPQFTLASLVLFAATPVFGQTPIGALTGVDWLLIGLIGAVGTTLPFAAFLVAANINSASRLALTGYTVPVASVVLAIIFLGERLTVPVGAGAVLIVGGVVLAARASPHVPEPGATTAT